MLLETDTILSEIDKDMEPMGWEEFAHLEVRADAFIPRPPAIISIQGQSVSTPGNITTLSGMEKVGKSSIMTMILAGAVSATADIAEDISIKPSEGTAVVHIETEQSISDHSRMVQRAMKRAGMLEMENYTYAQPDNFRSYNLRGLPSVSEVKDKVGRICERAARMTGGIHLIVIDGAADLISSVLDPDQSADLVKFFEGIAVTHNTAIITSIHQNWTNQEAESKERGHLGSELRRKSESVLSISKKDCASVLTARLLRSGDSSQVKPMRFTWNTDKHYHDFAGFVEGDGKSKVDHQAILDRVLPHTLTISYTDLVNEIVGDSGVSESTAKRYIGAMKSKKYLDHDGNGKYRRREVSGIS